ncbi:MAG: alpha/beta hydrolase [Bacteroidota bacterium]
MQNKQYKYEVCPVRDLLTVLQKHEHIAMKVFHPFLLLGLAMILFSSCDQKSLLPDPLPNNIKDQFFKESMPLEVDWSTPAPFAVGKVDFEFAGNVKYGKHKRNKFDIILPASDKPTPLVIYIHGGGFTRGDKKAAYIHTDSIRQFLQNGVAFATINYRYLEHTKEGVIESLEDCRDFLQFIRYYATDFNIDKERIAAYGPSAGGGAGLWLGTHDDFADPDNSDLLKHESTRLSAVVSLGTQATYDMARWEEIFREYDFSLDSPMFDQQILYNFYAIDSLPELYDDKIADYRAEVDMLRLLDADDAPLYVDNVGKSLPPEDILDLYHHPYHAHVLKQKAEVVGLDHVIVAEKSGLIDAENRGPVQFILQQFKDRE